LHGDFTLVSLGDIIQAHPVSEDSEARPLFDLVRMGDAAIANQEGVFFDLSATRVEAPGSPYILLGQAGMARDLKAMGIDMVGVANNHASDWGIEGLRAMTGLLDAAGVVHAGDGATLAEAQGARFLDTPKGRVALVAAASTYKQGAKAQDAIKGVPARAGISGLRLREIELVTPQSMAALRHAYGKPGEGDLVVPVNTPFAQPIEKTYRVGARPGFTYDMNSVDRKAILAGIRDARAKADLAVFTVHAHENADGMDDAAPGAPADFLVTLFHQAVDAGADVAMGTGPHSMRGIEIYKGKPIFYGLAVFLFAGNVVLTQEQQTERYDSAEASQADRRNPRDASFRAPASWDDGFVATTRFQDGVLKEVRLYPIEHGGQATPSRRETRLATPDRARRILATLRDLSAPFGTQIAIDGAAGVIRP